MTAAMMFEDRKAYETALRLAAEALGSTDPALAARERSVAYDGAAGLFTVPFIGGPVFVGFPSGDVRNADGAPLSGAVAVLALHYLVYRGEPLRKAGWLAYRDMPGARQFSVAFESMAQETIARRFDREPEAFRAAASALGGVPSGVAPLSFVFDALPKVPIASVLWEAAEGHPGSAPLLFKPSAPFYLHSEDLAALGVVLAERLVSVAGGRENI